MTQPFPKIRTWIAIFVLLIVLGLAKSGGAVMPQVTTESFLQISQRDKISLLVADTSFERMRGLSNRRRLSVDEGMFFIFPSDDYHGIWMKEMRFPIDIIWIDGDMRVVDIKQNIAPETFPAIFYPREKARYVLEVNAGFSVLHNLKRGDLLRRI